MEERIQVTLDRDVAEALARRPEERGVALEREANAAMRAGLGLPERKRFVVRPLDIGPPKPGYNFDSISTLLAQAEGEDYK